MRICYKLLFLVILLLLTGCSSRTVTTPSKPVPIAHSGTINLNNLPKVKQRLYSQYREWKGVDYRIGGLDKSGIDCSGFAYVTYRSKLGMELPRTTELQADTGTFVEKSALQTGDLVFFKTGMFVRHVGIYLENRRFLHASTSKGVVISSLDNVYWKAKYWKAKRVR